jgi:hypothetical protein
MTHSPPSSKPGATASASTRGPKPGQKTRPTTCRSDRDLSKVTHVDGVSYCDVCGYYIDSQDNCSPTCPAKPVSFEGVKREYQKSGGGDR